MQSTLNYATHAYEDLARWQKSFPMNSHTHQEFQFLLNLISKSEKFILPNCGELIELDDTILNEELEPFIRLPYPVTLLEIPWDMDTAQRKLPITIEGFGVLDCGGKSTKRIALLWDYEVMKSHPSFMATQIDDAIAKHLENGFFLLSLYFSNPNNTWLFVPAAAWIPRKITPPSTSSLESRSTKLVNDAMVASGANMSGARIESLEFPMVTSFCDQMKAEQDLDTYIAAMASDTSDELTCSMEFLVTINCSNVDTTQTAAPINLNKKRALKGKPPLYSYRLLNLDFGSAANQTSNSSGGTHASPRTHMRRGHIRHIAEGKITWVRPAVIGVRNAGVVEKDYVVTNTQRARFKR